MMSQIIMSMSARRSYSGSRTRVSFFVTCVPIVVRYSSSNMLIVYRRINDVFPTALSPTRQTFDFNCFCLVIRRPRPEPRPDFDAVYLTIRALFSRLIHVDSRRDRDALSLEDHGPEPTEEDLHILPRFRRGVEVRRLERPHGLLDLLVAVQDHDFVFQIDLVDRIDDRDLADDVEDALHPVVEFLERRVPREVAHRDDPFRAVEERFFEEIPEAFLPHDVPDGHVHVDLRAVRGLERHLALRDLCAQRGDVAVVELVLDEPPDEGGLADRGFADETDLRLDALGLGHRGRRRIPIGLLKGSAGCPLRKEPFSSIVLLGATRRLIVEQAVDAGASGIICHGFVGEDSVRACVDAAGGKDVFVVVEMSHPGGVEYTAKHAEDLARLATRANATGIVAPATRPERVSALRAIIGRKQILAPGVGAQGGKASEAIVAGADAVIVGRAIYEAANPAAAATAIATEIRSVVSR